MRSVQHALVPADLSRVSRRHLTCCTGWPRLRGQLTRPAPQALVASPAIRRPHDCVTRSFSGHDPDRASTSDGLGAGREGTIYALSSGAGTAAIAVIRISGLAAVQIYQALCPDKPLPKPRCAVVRTLYEPSQAPAKDTILDPGALVLFFQGPKSVTGEDVIEFHIHGGRAVVQAVLAAISRVKAAGSRGGIRYAEPGEFTRRAFLNDRLDLTQVEALGDTLAAVTEQQRRLSVRGAASGLGKRYEAWRRLLLEARGELEALIDFAEDQQFEESPATLIAAVTGRVGHLRKQMQAYSENAVRGELLRNGLSVSLLGAPNAGKSSLLNRIVGREAAIVSREEGTTRDVIEIGIDIAGWYCRLVDMAGLRVGEPSHPGTVQSMPDPVPPIGEIELEGIRRARQKALESDVVVVVLSIEDTGSRDSIDLRMNQEVMETAAQCSERSGNIVVVVNKLDRISRDAPVVPARWKQQIMMRIPNLRRDRIFGISCKLAQETTAKASDSGRIQAMLRGLVGLFEELTSAVMPQDYGDVVTPVVGDKSAWEESLGASKRQKLLLDACLAHLDEFLRHVRPPRDDGPPAEASGVDVVVAAESLRGAADCLGKITGKAEAGDVEEVLGVIFEK